MERVRGGLFEAFRGFCVMKGWRGGYSIESGLGIAFSDSGLWL